MRKGSNSKGAYGNLAIISVALQDHITRSLLPRDLSLCDRAKSPRSGVPTATRCARPPDGSRVKRRAPRQHGGTEEYVLDPAPAPLTLAQRLGLVEAPARRLTADEWSQVKTRSVDEGDSARPCAICREEFGLQAQVLLSCSHVFHRACLRAFESFSGRKSCPMCRRERYETRLIHDGARLCRERCATRIQAWWRGHAARKWYRAVRKTVPPKDKRLRRRFFEEKLQELNDSFVRSCQTDVESFLSEIDRSLSRSRGVFRRFQREHVSGAQEEDWEGIQNKVIQRDTRDCPICLTPLCSLGLGAAPAAGGPLAAEETLPPHRRGVLLSCSHLFHRRCLDAFESFCLDGRPTCPLCRSPYHKRPV